MKKASTFALLILMAISTVSQASNGTTPTAQTSTQAAVKLTSFTSEVTVSGAVALNWVTTREENNASYVIERSTDAKNFEVVRQIAAAGNSTETRTYQLLDSAPLKGVSYYRLRQISVDGQTSATRPVAIEVISENAPSALVAVELSGMSESTALPTVRKGK